MRAHRPVDEADGDAAPMPQDPIPGASMGKGAPTPRRKEAERARMERLHPVLTKKEQRGRDRELKAKKRDIAFQATESRAERVLLRNNVDAHWSVCEFSWPVIFLLLAVTLASRWVPLIASVGTIGIWLFFAVCAIDVALRWRNFKKEAARRIPDFNPKTRGLLSYMGSRMITMRRFRTPAAVVARGEEY